MAQYRFLVVSDDQHHRRSAAELIRVAGQKPPAQVSLHAFNNWRLADLEPLHCIFVSFSPGSNATADALKKIEERYGEAEAKPLLIVLADTRYRADAEASLSNVPHEPHGYLTLPFDFAEGARTLQQALGDGDMLDHHRS